MCLLNLRSHSLSHQVRFIWHWTDTQKFGSEKRKAVCALHLSYKNDTMADVRSLLRSERAQRRINHPQATYTATGTLECSVCHIPLKSDQEVWSKHLKSTQHAMRAERLRLSTSRPSEPATTREVSTGSKKRKADDGEDDSRKRTRPVVDVPGGFFDEIIEANTSNVNVKAQIEELPVPEPSKDAVPSSVASTLPSHPLRVPTIATPIDEDEWAAFERDVATPPPDPSNPSVFTAEATISAAPLTAAEIAAQAREQANQQSKEKRDVELEGEKEDAARALEDEFDEMEGLEERVARLRRMREEIRERKAKAAEEGGGGVNEVLEEGGALRGKEEDEDEDSDEEDDPYGWGALGR